MYAEETFSISIKDLRIIDGQYNPTTRVLSMVQEWIMIHQAELLHMWETQDIHQIDPLQ